MTDESIAVTRAAFFVPGLPAAQPRPKARAVRTHQGAHAQVYTPKTADAWKAQVVHEARDLEFFADRRCAVGLRLTFAFHRPRAHFGTGRNEGIVKDSAPVWHVQRPDADNITKAIKDALKGHLWEDDCQVVEMAIRKQWCSSVHEQGVRVVVEVVGIG